MRRASFQWWCFGTLVLGLVSGCQELGLPIGLMESSPAPGSQAAPESQADMASAEPDVDLASQAQAHAQRVAAVGGAAQTGPPQEILWRDLGAGPGTGGQPLVGVQAVPATPVAHAEHTKPTATASSSGVIEAGLTTADIQAPPHALTSQTPGASARANPSNVGEQLTQAQVYEQYLQAVRGGGDSNLSKAVTAATLAAVGPHGELDWSMLASLSPEDQELVQRYHRAVTTLRGELLAGGGEVDREAVAHRLDELYGSQPVSIRTIELCEKVMGYGVYDTFPDHTFVAGRQQKLIVYVELDHFKPMKQDRGDGYEVRLRQELELYESNGFEVWSHEPVQITDVSHNKRRDFFVVQLVTLPAELRMGQYHLKIRVYDENAGTRDEASVAITLVADDSLVKGTAR